MRTALLVAVSILAAAPAVAGPILYAVDRAGGLYSIDGATAASTFIGSMGVSTSNEIEIDQATGAAYVLYSGLGGQNIQQVDLATADLIGSPALLGVEFAGLEFVGATLYGTGNIPGLDLATINPTTGAWVPIAHPSTIRAGGLAYSNTTSTMYAVGDVEASFYTIDLITGSRADIGPLSGTLGRSLTLGSDGQLYVASREGLLYTISATGNLGIIGDTGISGLLGLASAPVAVAVPEPATFTLFGTGLSLLVRRQLRRRSANATR
jgi:hypothetical protein